VRPSYSRWVAGIERHSRAILAASALVCVLSALSLTRVRLDADVLGMLPRGQPAFDDFKAFVADFGELDELVVLVQGAPLSQLQAFADAFAERLRGLDTVAAVHARIDVQQVMDGIFGRLLYNYLPEADYAELEKRLTPAGIEAQVVADRAILSAPFDLSAARSVVEDPLGVRRLAASAFAAAYGDVAPSLSGGYFTAPDGSALLVIVRPSASAFDTAFSERLMRQVHAAEADARRASAADALRVEYTGSYIYALEDAGTLRRDITRYTALALCGVLAVFYFGYRNLRVLPFTTYPLIVTTLVTFALSLLLFDELNAVSISFAAILYGLSIDSGIYFYTRLLEERQHRDIAAAVTATLTGLGRANVAASATTAVAFLVIGFSCLTAVRQLGLLTALGMLLTTFEFFTLYPALGFWFARSAAPAANGFHAQRLADVARKVTGRATAVGISAAVLGALLVLAARHVELDVSLTHLQPAASEAARVQDQVTTRFGDIGSGGAVLVRRTTLEDALADGEAVARQLSVYKGEGLLDSVQSVAAVLPSARVQRARLDLYDHLPRAAAIDTLRAALARHGFVPERFATFFEEFRQPRHDLVSVDSPALAPVESLIQHHVRARHGQYIVATYVRPAPGVSLSVVAARLQRELGTVPAIVAARPLLEEQLRTVLQRESLAFFTLGIVGNFALLLVSFHSVGIAVAILAPVLLVLIGLFAGMAAAGVALDPVNLIVTPLIFGIGVDYGVYIVARARECGSIGEALRCAGRAVVVTALTTITGFGFLGLSRFPALSTMGLLAAAGLFLCLVLSIVLLPALLALLSEFGTRDPRPPNVVAGPGRSKGDR
jgi:uncharacterized protein